MKKLRIFKNLTILAVSVFMIAATGFAQKPTVKLKTTPVQVNGDMVTIEGTINIPNDKIFQKDGELVIMAELGDQKFPRLIVPKSQLKMANNMYSYDFKQSMLFDEDMIGNDLEIETEYQYDNGKKNKEFKDVDEIAECCVTSGMLVMRNTQFETIKVDYTPSKTTPLKVVAQLNFPFDISKLPTTSYSKEVKEIGEYLKANPNATVTIKGFASPEGTSARNRELAKERAANGKIWLKDALAANGYKKQAKSVDFDLEYTYEDWNGFKKTIMNSNLSANKKEKVTNIVNKGLSQEETEKEVLAVLGGREAAEPYLQPLRRTTIVASSSKATRSPYTTAQIDSISQQHQNGKISNAALRDVYSQEEYLQAAQRRDAKEGKLSLLTSYHSVYPGDTRVYSELGRMTVVQDHLFDMIGGDDAVVGIGFDRDMWDIDADMDLDERKIKYKLKVKEEDANGEPLKYKYKYKAELDKAEGWLVDYEEVESNFASANNLGAYYFYRGDLAYSKSYLEKSLKRFDSPAANYNMGVYYAVDGDFEKALKHFNKASSIKGSEYNHGLALMMNGQYKAADEKFNMYLKSHPNSAAGHYLIAINAARSGDTETLYTHLPQAIAINKKISDLAKEDLEFQAYWDTEKFEDASDDDPKMDKASK